MAPSITKARSLVNVMLRQFNLAKLLSLLSLLVGLSLLAGPVLGQTVYIRNQRLSVSRVEGNLVVESATLQKLLTSAERSRIQKENQTLVVTNDLGQVRRFQLSPYGELAQWEELLTHLGYRKQENPSAGVVDWLNAEAGSAPSQVKAFSLPSEAELRAREEASRRRSGYRSAKRTYDKVMELLGPGGTESEHQRITEIGYRIVAQSPLAELHWTFDIAATPVPNALCTGEGFVVVTEGLLALDLSDDELAGVLGHEVAHGVRRHAQLYEERYAQADHLVRELRRLEAEVALAEEANDSHQLQVLRGRLNRLMPKFKQIVNYVENQQAYNRQEEEEADVLGITYATAAGYDPDGEGRALLKLKQRSVELFGQAYQEGSRTHPPLKRRLEILMLVQKRWRSEQEQRR